MRYMKWIGLLAVILLIISCFLPWVIINSKNLVVTGIDSTGTNFGKPGYVHFIFGLFFVIFHFIPKLWAKRWNLLLVALNIAWAVRNYLIISMCREGECPEKQAGLWLVLVSSVLMLFAALFPDIKLKEENKANQAP
ncbi:MAG TPA: hypothetical protein VFP97_10410 [Chitinophagaceae bacterium]|nr:hypothetical protein [Chitinophagaceae bacterium]